MPTLPVIGTAGWAIPRAVAPAFPAEGSSLQRYAARFGGAEINSSFHRPHRRSTWQRWHDSVPPSFRFSVKLPKTISHERRLVDCAAPLASFLDEVSGLGDKLAILLLQLPPRLSFDAVQASSFFTLLTGATAVRIACEPRHPGWFEPEADALLDAYRIARVAADPAILPAAAVPGGWPGLAYWRLHGSPRTYYSGYDDDRLDRIARALPSDRSSWCIFDNTASGAAAGDALRLLDGLARLSRRDRSSR